MSSTPLIASSIGVATVSAITFGLAPGYCARTTTDGGTTSGYSEIGSTRSASRPAMKTLGRFMGVSTCGSGLRDGAARRRLGLCVHRHHLRRHERAWAHALHAV